MSKMKKISAVALLIAAAFTTVACNEKKAENTAPATQAQASADYKNTSYSVGALFGANLKQVIDQQQEVIEYEQDQLIAGIRDALNGKVDTENAELKATIQQLEEQLKSAIAKKEAEKAKKSQEEAEKFIAEFKQKDGVKQTETGLLYRIEKAGEGNAPKAKDVVSVHYTGKLSNGTVFDSSIERGQPAEFTLNQVIAGWSEGLQLLKKGGKMELVIPANLAYGDQDLGIIPPHSTLHFEVELLDIIPAK